MQPRVTAAKTVMAVTRTVSAAAKTVVAAAKTVFTKSQPCFFTKSVRFGRTELSICRICAEWRDLQSEHDFRACSLKNV